MGELRRSGAPGGVNVFRHAVTGNVHLPQTLQNFLGAGVIVVRDEALQLGDQRLCALGSGRGAPDGAERARTLSVSFTVSSPRGGAKEAHKQYESKQEVRA